ncbi:hypothetical protein POM88_002766 [Heracleum sosnowskyi]|uniref:Chromo domain-containing protein n=1 Tax=Heracleum sosnowskyi TaxID=360622 RepID=A0AAD8JGA7_9APIA|nr:hypothetical protein POM88_002766 [Heracleum sosnowskyi]
MRKCFLKHRSVGSPKSLFSANTPSPAINANTKWTSRKPVIEWLKSLVRKDDLPSTNSSLQEYNEGDHVMLRHRTERLLTPPYVSAQPTTDVPVDVLDERFMPTRRGGFRQYLVHWSNRSDDERSWISATEFRRLAPDLFEHYTRFSSTEPNFH